jgi:hypothetical protein
MPALMAGGSPEAVAAGVPGADGSTVTSRRESDVRGSSISMMIRMVAPPITRS